MKSIRIALKQFFPVPGGVKENAGVILDTLRDEALAGTELVCFPECSLTGYTVENAAGAAVGLQDDAVREICAFAGTRRMIVSFGLLEKTDRGIAVSQIISGPGGTVCYRKTHLGLKEQKAFIPGDSFPVYRTKDICIGTCLCWESHIPEIAGVYRKQGIHILLVPYAAGMRGEKCRENWSIHLPARASDNGIFVAAVNGLTCSDGSGSGGIALYDPKGRIVSDYFGEGEKTLRAEAGGLLPRECDEDMNHISYYDHRRPEILFR